MEDKIEIEVKSIGMLLDELCTVDIKCFLAQEVVMNPASDKELCVAAKQAQELNAKRNALIRAIDKRLGEETISPTSKTYSDE